MNVGKILQDKRLLKNVAAISAIFSIILLIINFGLRKDITTSFTFSKTYTQLAQLSSIDITSGLEGWWKFDQADNIGKEEIGRYPGSVSAGINLAAGKVGTGSVEFDATSKVISLSADPIKTNTITACAWFYPRTATAGDQRKILDNGRFQLYLTQTNTSKLALTSDTVKSLYSGAIQLNTWTHFCVVRQSDGTGTFFINGSIGPSGNTGTAFNGWSNLQIGKGFDGYIDEVRLYDRALSSEQISQIYAYTQTPVVSVPEVPPIATSSDTNIPTSTNQNNIPPVQSEVGNSLVPPDRTYSWGDNVGVIGGIPKRTNICANIKESPFNAKGDGITDDTVAITSALASCPPNSVLYIPAGTYKILGRINATKSNITWRGDGAGKTILKLFNGNEMYVGNGDWPVPVPTVNIMSGATRGSREVIVDNSSNISVGKLITITQTNPSWVHFNSTYYGAGPTDDGHDNTRLMAFTVRVISKIGNSVTLEHPLPIDMINSPMITIWSQIVSGTGFEDMTFDMEKGGGRAAIFWNQTYGCWVKGVEIKNTSNRFLWFNTSVNFEIRNSYFHDALVRKKEGLDLVQNDTFFLIENNTLVRAGWPMIILGDWGGGVSQNVVSYNYLEDEQGLDSSNTPAPYALSDNHGAHNMFNLFEGNVAQNYSSDGYYGGSSHGTLFRNRLTGEYDRVKYLDDYAINLSHWATSYNIVGNVLGLGSGYSSIYKASGGSYLHGVIYKIGYPNCCNMGFSGTAGNPSQPNFFDTNVLTTAIIHGNFDYVTNSTIWDPNISVHLLPNSLYLRSKPLWFGSNFWPPIGPDVPGLANKIPAQVCYEQGKMPDCLYTNGNSNSGELTGLPGVSPSIQPPIATPPVSPITPPDPDTLAPSLTGISAPSVSVSSALVTWTTSEPATGQIQYGLTTAYGSLTALVSTLTTMHTVSLTNLLPNTTYHYRVISKDAAGNTSTSGDGILTTPARFVTPVVPVVPNTPPAKTPVNNIPPPNYIPVKVPPKKTTTSNPSTAHPQTNSISPTIPATKYGTSTEVIFTSDNPSIWKIIWDFILYIVGRVVNGVMKVVGKI